MRRLYALAILLLLAGCSDRSFVGRRVDNFTAYYNTFYNAREAFDEATQQFEEDPRPVNGETYLPVFIEPSSNVNNQPLEQAIEKSADLLRDHPNSKWVDDALLLIGKAYYYQQNYVGAEQKFREVVGLNGGLEGEARFWMGRTLVTAGRYAEANEYLRESLNTQEDHGDWAPRMQLAQAEAYVRQARWEDAATALDAGLQGKLDGQTGARAAFLLGQVRETLRAYDLAERAYRRALNYRAPYELSYAARLNAIRLEGLHGNTQAALADLRHMERDDKNYEKRAEMQFLRGRLLQAQGRYNEARRTYHGLLYQADEAPGSDVRGKTHYALGQLYRDALKDYTTAAAHFDTAATALGTPATDDAGILNRTRLAPGALTDSRMLADRFGRLADKAEAVRRLDSLLYLGSLSDEDFREAIAELEEQRAEEVAQRVQEQQEQARTEQFAQGGALMEEGMDSGSPEVAAAAAQGGAGFLFHRDPTRVQEMRRNFVRRWGERPRVPNWRRLAAISGERPSADRSALAVGVVDGQAALGDVPVGIDTAETFGADAFDIDVSDVPRDAGSQARMQAARARARYELANALFLAAGQADSAATWYRIILREEEDTNVRQQALYALAEALHASSETEDAEAYYRELIETYPTSEFADRARERLDLEVAARPVVDSTALAEAAYAEARQLWHDEQYTEAMREMVAVAEAYPQTSAAPKALLATGMILIEQQDDVRATTPLPPEVANAVQVIRGAASDSAASVPPDSFTFRFGLTPAPTQDRAIPSADPYTLQGLFEVIANQYPDTPQSQRAADLLAVWEQRAGTPDGAIRESESGEATDSDLDARPLSDSRALSSDSLGARMSPRADEMLKARLDEANDEAPNDEAPKDEWVIVLASETTRAAADSTREVYARRFNGQPVRVISSRVNNQQRYRLTLGSYGSYQATKEAMEARAEQLPGDAWPLLMQPEWRFGTPGGSDQ